MSKPTGLNGQWLGSCGGTDPGEMHVNIDEFASFYGGVAFLRNDNSALPATEAGFSIPGKNHTFEVRTNYLLPRDPTTLEIVPFDKIQPLFGPFSKYADIKGTLDGDILNVTWKTEIGGEGSCSLPRSKSGEPSELQAQEMNWNEYKEFVAGLRGERQIFRGQNKPHRLRTQYDRLRPGRDNTICPR